MFVAVVDFYKNLNIKTALNGVYMKCYRLTEKRFTFSNSGSGWASQEGFTETAVLEQYLHSRGWPTFSLKGQIINILSFLGHTLFVTITRLCSCSLKAARDTEQMNGCYYVTRKLYLLQWVVGQTGPMGQCADPCFEGWVSFNLLEEERKIITVSGKGSRNVLSSKNKTLLENC